MPFATLTGWCLSHVCHPTNPEDLTVAYNYYHTDTHGFSLFLGIVLGIISSFVFYGAINK